MEKLQALFPKMRHYMMCGFNLLIYGVGSKRNFVNNFAMSQMQ